MNNPNLIASIAYTFETEGRRNNQRSDASVDGSVYANPPAWAGFSLRKVWDSIRMNTKLAPQAIGKENELQEASQKV